MKRVIAIAAAAVTAAALELDSPYGIRVGDRVRVDRGRVYRD